jgi:CubicO group peptidase (beta-lactamase class C family)
MDSARISKSRGPARVTALGRTTDTRFLICSITKSFTATGLALLVDERRLDWKKRVRDYIPEFRLHDTVATDRVTVRDLLRHHSGLRHHDWIWAPGDLSPAQMLAAMRYLEPSDDIRRPINTRTSVISLPASWPNASAVRIGLNLPSLD